VFQKLAGKPKFEVRGAMREGLMGVMRNSVRHLPDLPTSRFAEKLDSHS